LIENKDPLSLEFLRFELNSTERITLDSQQRIKRRILASYGLLVTVSGSLDIEYDSRSLRLHQGQALLLLPGTAFEVKAIECQILELYWVSFNASHLLTDEQANPSLALASNQITAINPFADFVQLLETIYETNDASNGLLSYKRYIRFQEVVYAFLAHILEKEPIDSKEAVVKTIEYVTREYHRTLEVDQLSLMAGLGRRQFTHLFKLLTGKSPMEYLNDIRIARSKQLLSLTSAGMREIAKSVGYKDEFYFSRCFKHYVGVSPRTYKNEHARRMVQHAYGETEIPSHPRRIASVLLHDMLLSLEVPLVFAALGCEDSYLEAILKQRNVQISESHFIDFEALQQSKPDVIVAAEGIDRITYNQLNQIAPTIVYHRDCWRTSILRMGKDLGVETKANLVVRSYGEKLKRARQTIIKTVGEKATVAFIRTLSDHMQLFLPTETGRGYADVLYNELGLKLHAKTVEYAQTSLEFAVAIPLEALQEIKADYIFVTAGFSSVSAEEMQLSLRSFEAIQQTSTWQQMSAVVHKRIYKVPARSWMLNGPIADSQKVDEIMSSLMHNVN